jgi:topoisomerase-4 subunit A
VGIAHKKTVISVVYKDPKLHLLFAKRFVVSKFILDKQYRFFDEGMKLEFLSTAPDTWIKATFKPKAKQKVKAMEFNTGSFTIKGVAAKGVRVSPKEIKGIKVLKARDSKEASEESKEEGR